MRLASLPGPLSFIGSLASAALLERQAVPTSIYTFSGSGAWIEGMAVRSNGHLLLNRLDVAELWDVDPVTKTGTKLLSFPGAKSMAGITEVTVRNESFCFLILSPCFADLGDETCSRWEPCDLPFCKDTFLISCSLTSLLSLLETLIRRL